jgi:hypothetical protein
VAALMDLGFSREAAIGALRYPLREGEGDRAAGRGREKERNVCLLKRHDLFILFIINYFLKYDMEVGIE